MSRKLIVDPITRIEGHLKIEVEIEDGKVKDAWSSGTMYRGFEKLLEGKDPRDAPFVTSRICGVCFSVHTMASVLALDEAFGANVPDGGRLLRNLVMGAHYMYDHILHFYHLSALDYLDIMAVAKYEGGDAGLKAVKNKLVGLVEAGDTHPLTPRYKPDEYCISDPETVTTLVKHYLDALKMQMLCKKLGAIFGGRAPHYQNMVVGGVTQLPTREKMTEFRELYKQCADFVKNVYLKDVLAVGTGPLFPLAKSGFGKGHVNYMAYGAFDQKNGGDPLFTPGVILGDLTKIHKFDPTKITESVKNSWYKEAKPTHPYQGEQEVDRDKTGAYSFVKSPRYDGAPLEVGPLARMLIMQNPTLMELVGKGAQPGVVARHASRAIECLIVAEAMEKWIDELDAMIGKPGLKIHDTDHWDVPDSGKGAGFYDAPRGALGHWIVIENGKTKRYQAVVPSTWNASPRDEKGVRGQYEESLIGIPVPDPDNPLNIVRVIRSFDPCLACAIHMIDPNSNELKKFAIDPMMGS